MKKNHLLIILTVLLVVSFSGIKAQGFLKTNGKNIVNENGTPIIWRGMGLGGWMLQEGYMLGTSGPQYTIESRIKTLVGEEKKNQFYEAWLSNHLRKIDVDSLASWGYNMIRLPIHYKLFTPPIEKEPIAGQITWNEKGFAMTDSLLAWCKANNIYLILDMHAAPGGQGENADISDYDPTKPSLWESSDNRNKMIALWKKLAERYANEPMIAAYDLINEPNWGFQNHASDKNGCAETANTPLWQLQKDITAAIRQVDTKHIIIIEGNCWGNNYNGLPTLWDNNIVISYHKYWNANTQGSIQGMLDMRNQRNVPIWLGETGENSNVWFTDAVSLFETNNIGWSWWPLKKLGLNNPLQIKNNTAYQSILNFWGGSGAKPSETTAFNGLMQLAEDLKLENNRYQKDVVDAKIRQPHTNETIPYKQHKIVQNGQNTVFATEYDLGKVNFAYYDKVSNNTTGNAGGATWNSGYSFRNDGVDIQAVSDQVSNGYNVGWIEDKEWLKYTIEVEQAGTYQLKIRSACDNANGKLSVFVNEIRATEIISLPNTGGLNTWNSTLVDGVYLEQGKQEVKLYFDKGGFNFNYFQFSGPSNTLVPPRLLGTIGTHTKKRLELTFNQPFQEIPANPGFSISVNGQIVPVENVSLTEGISQIIQINLAAELYYGDTVLANYTGNALFTKSGVALDPFSDQRIIVKLEGGLDPLSVPGKIEAEDYTKNNGFELETSLDQGGGSNVGYTDNGDYLDYIVNITKAGNYEVDYRVASQSNGGSLSLKTVNNEGQASEVSKVTFASTGGWQTWSTSEGSKAYLEKGVQTLRLQATSSLFNINWFRLVFFSNGITTGIDGLNKTSRIKIYPNPSSDQINLEIDKDFSPQKITFLNSLGSKVLELEAPFESKKLIINHKLDSGLYLILIESNGLIIQEKLVVE